MKRLGSTIINFDCEHMVETRLMQPKRLTAGSRTNFKDRKIHENTSCEKRSVDH